jgi:hypothetical protein
MFRHLFAALALAATTIAPVSPAQTQTTPETREAMLQRAYRAGVQRNPRVQPADSVGWKQLAGYTGLGYDDLVNAYDAIAVVNLAYKQLLERQPDSVGGAWQVLAIRNGMRWQEIWRNIAQSPEREQRFGYWSPAPLATSDEVQSAFGYLPYRPEQCFGAIGTACEGGAPQVPGTPDIQPRWVDQFTLPDGTVMGWVEQGVAVGSILHDNACLRYPTTGLNCNGVGVGAVTQMSGDPAAQEWSKAWWNVLDGRTWRERFGPYPVDVTLRRSMWYDDMRITRPRQAWMKVVVSLVVGSAFTEEYQGKETRGTRRLAAPSGRGLDERDEAFCRSGAFNGGIQWTPFTAWGVCR